MYYNKTDRVTVHRHAERADYERGTVESILDVGLVAHVGLAVDDQPYVIPVLYVRDGATVYLHGSPLSRLLGRLAAGARVCLTVTLTDGLVLARSAFHHSVNYRSAVVLGTARAVAGEAEKRHALERLVEHVVPGRTSEARRPSRGELRATEVVALAVEEASAKIRSGPPVESRRDLALPVWAGQLPLRLAAGAPEPDAHCTLPVPGYLSAYAGLPA
jgi:nitroimidazol reductase NimA-like FMN-containing flavoprotein (pyridoxamine 5'-phosphate oxidase superfamily)